MDKNYQHLQLEECALIQVQLKQGGKVWSLTECELLGFLPPALKGVPGVPYGALLCFCVYRLPL